MELKLQTDIADQIIKVINAVCEKLGMTVDWTQQNILPYLQELGQRIIKYEIGLSIIWLIIGLALVISAIIIICKLVKAKRPLDSDEILDLFTIIYIAVGIVVGSIIVYIQIDNILTCIYMPEKVWLHYFNDYASKLNLK